MEKAPPEGSVEAACMFWRKFAYLMTDGDTRRWGTSLYRILVDLSDGDPLLESYEELSMDSEALTGRMRALLDCAFEIDPSSRLGIYHEACVVDKLVSNISNIIGELIILRMESARSLSESEKERMLIHQTL